MTEELEKLFDNDLTPPTPNNAIYSLEQERDEWKKKYEDVANENLKEIYELIKKNDCWRGVVNVVCSKLEQENKRYKQLLQGCPADGDDCGFCEIDKRNKELEQENKELRSALNEIKEIIHPISSEFWQITEKEVKRIINEVLND